MLIQMEVEISEPRYFSEECSEFEKIVKLIQSNRVDAAELIFEELKKSMIKRKGRWLHEDRVWPHQNGQTDRDKSKRKLKIIDNQELYTRFVPAGNEDENKPPVKETKVRDKFDEIFDLTKDEEKNERDNKRLTVSNRNEIKDEINNKETKESKKNNKTESNNKSKEEMNGKVEKTSKSNEESNGKTDKPQNSLDDDVELLLSLSNGDQDSVEPKMLRKRKEVKKESSSLHRVSNGGIQKKKSSTSNNSSKSTKGNEPLFNLKENMKQHDGDGPDSGKIRQKMFYGSTQVTRRDKPRREGTLADDSKKRLEAKLKKVKAKLKKSI